MSAAPVRRASAHCEGTVKERSILSVRTRRGPWVKPRINGAGIKILHYGKCEVWSR